MPDSFDELLKDKMNSFEAPYVEGDWNKMEQLLDNEKGAGWLPLLWAFVFGVLAVASLWLIPNNKVEQANIRSNSSVAFAQMNNGNINDVDFSPAANGADKAFSTDENEAKPTVNGNELKETEPAFAENSPGELKPADEKNKPSDNSRRNKVFKNSAKPAAKNDSGNSGKALPFQGNKNTSGKYLAGNGKEEQTKNSVEQPIDFSRSNPFGKFPFIEKELAVSLLSQEFFSDLPDKVPATQSKNKCDNLISGSIGLEGGINEGFFSKSSFAKPGYNVGLTEELMFLKRIGIASSQSFSQSKYQTTETNCPEGVFCPVEVSSTFRKLDITIDIKANLVNTPKWSYYVKAGIQNNFKLQETLNLEYPALPVPTPVPADTPTTIFIPSLFSPNADGANGAEADVNRSNSVPYPSQEAFSVFGEKKYYLAYHAATGFQYHLKKNFSLQMEAGYFISHRKPEYLGKRLQSLNMNVGVVYGLGR